MLVEVPYKEGDTISCKTVAGEEIVARLTKVADTYIRVHKPMVLTATQSGLGLAPFTFTVDKNQDIDLRLENLLFIAKTEKNMASQYIQSTTGLKVN